MSQLSKTRNNSKNSSNRIKSQQNVVLPYIAPDANPPPQKKTRTFDLGGMYNASMPKYSPFKDKNLKYFFDKPTVKKIIG